MTIHLQKSKESHPAKRAWWVKYRQCSHRHIAKRETGHGEDITSSAANSGTFLAYRTGQGHKTSFRNGLYCPNEGSSQRGNFVEPNLPVSMVSETTEHQCSCTLSAQTFNKRAIPLQTLQHWSLPVSQRGVSWPVLFSYHTLRWRTPGDPSPACSDKELWMKTLSMPDLALTAKLVQSLHNTQTTSKMGASIKKYMTLCRKSKFWSLPLNLSLAWNLTQFLYSDT